MYSANQGLYNPHLSPFQHQREALGFSPPPQQSSKHHWPSIHLVLQDCMTKYQKRKFKKEIIPVWGDSSNCSSQASFLPLSSIWNGFRREPNGKEWKKVWQFPSFENSFLPNMEFFSFEIEIAVSKLQIAQCLMCWVSKEASKSETSYFLYSNMFMTIQMLLIKKPTQSYAPKWTSQQLLLRGMIKFLPEGNWFHEHILSDALASVPPHICSAPEMTQLIDSSKQK